MPAIGSAAVLHIGPVVMALPLVTRLVTRSVPGGRSHGHIALTFDDGPHPEATPAVLKILAGFGVTATFFLIGEQVQEHPAVARRIVDAGHGVGVHGWTHQLLPRQSPLTTVRGINRAHRTITQATGAAPRWYRPPYGAATGPALLAAVTLGMTPVWWSSHGRDWAVQDPALITRRILRPDPGGRPQLDDRDVLLLHDSDRYAEPGSWKGTVAALPLILSALIGDGHRVGALPSGREPTVISTPAASARSAR